MDTDQITTSVWAAVCGTAENTCSVEEEHNEDGGS